MKFVRVSVCLSVCLSVIQTFEFLPLELLYSTTCEAQKVAIFYHFEAQKLLVSCLGFGKSEAQTVEKKVANKKNVYVPFRKLVLDQ